jgi:hypothetical protein
MNWNKADYTRTPTLILCDFSLVFVFWPWDRIKGGDVIVAIESIGDIVEQDTDVLMDRSLVRVLATDA